MARTALDPNRLPNYVVARREWERNYFRDAVASSPSISAAALRTGMDRSSLHRKLDALGLRIEPGCLYVTEAGA